MEITQNVEAVVDLPKSRFLSLPLRKVDCVGDADDAEPVDRAPRRPVEEVVKHGLLLRDEVVHLVQEKDGDGRVPARPREVFLQGGCGAWGREASAGHPGQELGVCVVRAARAHEDEQSEGH